MENLKNYNAENAFSNKYAYVIIWVITGFFLPISFILYLISSGPFSRFDFDISLTLIISLSTFFLGVFLLFRFYKPFKITNPRHDDDFIKSMILIFLLSLGSTFGLFIRNFPESFGLKVIFFIIPLIFSVHFIYKWNKIPLFNK